MISKLIFLFLKNGQQKEILNKTKTDEFTGIIMSKGSQICFTTQKGQDQPQNLTNKISVALLKGVVLLGIILFVSIFEKPLPVN